MANAATNRHHISTILKPRRSKADKADENNQILKQVRSTIQVNAAN